MNRRTLRVVTGGAMLAAPLFSAPIAAADDGGLSVEFQASDSDIDYALDLPGTVESGTGTGAFTLTDGDGNELGDFTDDNTSVFNILGIHTMEYAFDLENFDAAGDGADPGDLPPDGTEFSVVAFGPDIQNIYQTVPAPADGGGAETTDMLTTPLGTFELPTSLGELFSDGVTFEGGGLLGILSGEDAGDELATDTTIERILAHNDVEDGDFDGGDRGDVAGALADSDHVYVAGGDVTADEVTEALDDHDIDFADPDSFDAQDLADVLDGDGPSPQGLDQILDTVFGDGAIFDEIAETDGPLGDLAALISNLF